ncbi:unnamed protein product [Paramecium primaurelia]|uniref:EamA domain-containing protein n=2 Tax=Paramecium TaxID=5884 RepID=A0A8S1VK48_9CILI|nr:unnamed protein product [Paramecium primaurelia]CAD8178318.1 unnamed protein product [Paramecium pentaurelia]
MGLSHIFGYLKSLEAKNSLHVAIAYILVAYFFHAVQITFYKSAHFTVVPQSLFLRSFFSLTFIFMFQYKENYHPKNRTRYLIQSQTLGAVGSLFYFYGINFISLSEGAILFATNSIWSQLMVSFMNRERITKSRFLNSIICIIGIVLVVNPTVTVDDPLMHIVGCLCILICSVIQSLGFIIMKKIGPEVPSTITTSYFHIMIIITSSLQQQYIGRFEYFDGYYKYIAGFSLFTMLGQLIQFRAQTLVTYDKLCNYTYSQTLYIIIIDYVIFNKILSLNGIIGGSLILFGVFKQLAEDKKSRG